LIDCFSLVKEGNEDLYYAMRSSDALVFKVKADTEKNLGMTMFEIKDRHIFFFDPNDVVKASLKYDERESLTVKDTDKNEES